jgi:hypothetical protein
MASEWIEGPPKGPGRYLLYGVFPRWAVLGPPTADIVLAEVWGRPNLVFKERYFVKDGTELYWMPPEGGQGHTLEGVTHHMPVSPPDLPDHQPISTMR